MLKRFIKFFGDLDRRVKVTIVGTGIFTWSQRLTNQYKNLYATALGANPTDIGILNSVEAAFSSIASIPMGWAAEKYNVKTVMLLGFAFATFSAIIFALAGNWWMLIPGFIIGRRMVRTGPLSDIIFVTVTKPQKRSTIMSLSRVVRGIINTFAPMTAAFIVVYFGGINAQGIRPLYYLQLILTLFVFLFITRKLQPIIDRVEKKDNSRSNLISLIQNYRELFKGEKYLKRWIAIRVVRQFATSLASPFTVLWMVNVKGASPYILGIMSTISVIISWVFQIPAGRMADRFGRKKVYFLFNPVLYLGTFLLILAPNPEYLILVGVLGALAGGVGGGIGGVGNTPFITMWWESVPKEKRGRLFGVEGLFNLAAIPASIIGGILWQQGFMTEVLLIPVLLQILLVIPILTTIPETRSI